MLLLTQFTAVIITTCHFEHLDFKHVFPDDEVENESEDDLEMDKVKTKKKQKPYFEFDFDDGNVSSSQIHYFPTPTIISS